MTRQRATGAGQAMADHSGLPYAVILGGLYGAYHYESAHPGHAIPSEAIVEIRQPTRAE